MRNVVRFYTHNDVAEDRNGAVRHRDNCTWSLEALGEDENRLDMEDGWWQRFESEARAHVEGLAHTHERREAENDPDLGFAETPPCCSPHG